MKKIRICLFAALILAVALLLASCSFIDESVTSHVYDNDCDTTCNNACCKAEREITHVYDNDCDSECNVCGEARETAHVYDNSCDGICNVKGCGATREIEHVYDNGCDRICNVCEKIRKVDQHVYDHDCDGVCNTEGCGMTRTVTHVYDNNYDKVCNTKGCGYEREIRRQSVILLGQSNMAGRGDKYEVEPISDDRIFMMRDDVWVKMKEPIHTDKASAGIGLSASFAKAFVDTFDCEVGLVPAAVGGTSLADWGIGGELYNEAIRLIRIAMQTSDVCAILWHQGEADQNNRQYAEQLKVILDSMLRLLDIDESKIVIVTGELFGTRSDAVHRAQLDKLGAYYTNYGVAESDGLTVFDETTHFDSPSLRVFGLRYFAVFYNLVTGETYEFDDDPLSYYKPQPK